MWRHLYRLFLISVVLIIVYRCCHRGMHIDQIGDTELHPPTKRKYWDSHGTRLRGYGGGGEEDYSKYEANVLTPLSIVDQYPLWLSNEIRSGKGGGNPVSKKDEWKSPTAYHFHNFFMSVDEIDYDTNI